MDLRAEMTAALAEIDKTLDGLRRTQRPQVGVATAYGNLDANGRPLFADLLCARASLLVAIANLPEQT